MLQTSFIDLGKFLNWSFVSLTCKTNHKIFLPTFGYAVYVDYKSSEHGTLKKITKPNSHTYNKSPLNSTVPKYYHSEIGILQVSFLLSER